MSMSFEELKLAAPILKALADCGHQTPTQIQMQAIPKVLAGHDLIASAQTGTGKTAAFLLPALQRLSEGPAGRKPGVRVLVLSPTRELAGQTAQAARTYSKHLRVHSVAIYGGMPFGDQLRALSQKPDVIIATPGRLIDLIWRGRIDLSTVEMFVLDEADRMLDMGFMDDVKFVFEAVPKECQILLFAATMGADATKLAATFMKSPERVQVAPGEITHESIEQRLHMADSLHHKNRLLQHLCADSTVTRAIIFSATKRDADSLAHDLSRLGHKASALHADMTQTIRNRTVSNLRMGKIRLLVATDVAARGLDVKGISHVINFDLPRSAEDYVNRIGRTGRAGESGIAISFASRGDLPYLDRIEKYLGQNLSISVIPGLEPAYPIVRQHGGGQNGGSNGNGRSHASGMDSRGRSGGESRGRTAGRSQGRSQGRKSGSESPSFNSREMGEGGGYSRRGKVHEANHGVEPTVEYVTNKPGRTGRPVSGKPGKPERKIFM